MQKKIKYEKPVLCDLSERIIREGHGANKCQSGQIAAYTCMHGNQAHGGKCRAGNTPHDQCQVGNTAHYDCSPGAQIRPS